MEPEHFIRSNKKKLTVIYHRGPTQAASLVVCLKYKEMYGRILKSLIS